MEALPLGTARIRKRCVRKQTRQERFIKVSHHGKWWHRWRPYAKHWWETNIGPIPEGYQVYHRDGDPLNDQPANYVLCRADRFQLIFALHPQANRTQRRRRSKAVARANRRRGSIARAMINPAAWYLVLPESRAVVWQPCRCHRGAVRLVVPEQLVALCCKGVVRIEAIRGVPYADGHASQVVQGRDLQAGSGPNGAYEGFLRLVPDERRAPRRRRPQPTDNFVEVIAGQ